MSALLLLLLILGTFIPSSRAVTCYECNGCDDPFTDYNTKTCIGFVCLKAGIKQSGGQICCIRIYFYIYRFTLYFILLTVFYLFILVYSFYVLVYVDLLFQQKCRKESCCKNNSGAGLLFFGTQCSTPYRRYVRKK